VYQHGPATLAVWRKPDQPSERRRKAGQSERRSREGHEVQARPVKTFRSVGDIEKETADLQKKSNLRVKRRDPWPRANAPPKAVADLELNGQDAERNCRRVLTWFASRWRNHQSKRAEKPHSKLRGSAKRIAERPCYEADDSACRGE